MEKEINEVLRGIINLLEQIIVTKGGTVKT